MIRALGLGTLPKHRCYCLVFIYSLYFWLHWAFVAAHRLSSVAVSLLLIVVNSLVVEHDL